MKSLRHDVDLQSITERLQQVTPGLQPRWGRMTPPQAICHLSDSFLAAMGEKQVSMETTLLKRTAMKFAALYLPRPWPPGVKTRPEVEQGVGGTNPGDFAADRQQLIAVMRRFAAPHRDFTWQPHAIFGPLSDSQWLRWGYLHMDHHLRQFGV